MLGGEGPANPAWIATDTDMMRNAARFGALVFFLEHRFLFHSLATHTLPHSHTLTHTRYYGESHPTPDASLSSLTYLSSRQALRDAASFKQKMAAQFSLTEENRWISFGGSYSGALSGWLRMFFPDTVAAAVATSGPVQVGVA